MSKQSKKARFAYSQRERRIADRIHAANRHNPQYIGCNPVSMMINGVRIGPGAFFVRDLAEHDYEKAKLSAMGGYTK